MRFFSNAGELLDGPREWEPAVLDLEAPPADWESIVCTVNGESVPVIVARRFGEARVLVEWPRSGPGSYRIGAMFDDGAHVETVTIDSRKLGPDGLKTLVADLEQRLPVSIALGLQRGGGLAGVRLERPSENTLEQELTRLRRVIDGPPGEPGLRWLLPAIARDPHHMLMREERWVRREHARRVPVGGLLQTLTRPGNLSASGRPERVLDSRVERTFDVYENRLLKALTVEVEGRLGRLARLAGDAGPEWSHGLNVLRETLHVAKRSARFLDEVAALVQAPDHRTMVLLREPRYRVLLDRFREFHSSLWIELSDDRLESPLRNVPSLYQTWGTLEVIDALLDVAPELGFRVVRQRVAHRRPGGLFVRILRDGEPALRLEDMDGRTMTLIPERSYGSSGELRSASFTQRPDVAIELRSADGQTDVILFDPKYKLDADDEGSGLPVKSDVDKMHAYRDAVRSRDGRHVVRFAGTIYPGQTRFYGTDVAAIGGLPGSADIRVTLTEILGSILAGG